MKKTFTQTSSGFLTILKSFKRTSFILGLIVAILVGTGVLTVHAQAPKISYSTPKIYIAGTAISPLTPVQGVGGGAVPAVAYGQTTTLAGSTEGFNMVDASGASVKFDHPYGVAAADAAGNLYVADTDNHRIRKVTPAGAVTTWAGNGVPNMVNATGTAAQFDSPTGVAVDAAGNVYVADLGNNRIRKISSLQVVSTLAGTGEYEYVDGSGSAAKFNSPTAVAVDGSGYVYVADTFNNMIRKITISVIQGVTVVSVSTLAGQITPGSTDASGTAASFNNPVGVAVDVAGNVYVADQGNNKIRKVTSAGVVSTLASGFNNPYGVTVDAAGNVYVAEKTGNKISQISPAGVVSTLASTGFNNPVSLSYFSGKVYVADLLSHQIKEVITTGYTINPALPAGLSFNGATGVISGTPTAVSGTTDYIITAYNESGSATATQNIKVNPPPISNPDLAGFTINSPQVQFSPSFSPDITEYTATVPGASSLIQITPNSFVGNVSITISGVAVTPGQESDLIALNAPGMNTIIPIMVTSVDGTASKTYNLTVTRLLLSNANLVGLVLSQGNLVPQFSPGKINYTASVTNATTSITLTPTTNASANSTITVNGMTISSGMASGVITLTEGNNTITTVVLAQDGVASKTYTVVVIREPVTASTIADLNNLELSVVSNGISSPGILSPTFSSANTEYTVMVGTISNTIIITPTAVSVAEAITVNGVTVISGIQSDFITLNAAGTNTIIPVVVTSEDGSVTKTYTITVIRPLGSQAILSGLLFNGGNIGLSPTFSGSVFNYTINVDENTNSTFATPFTQQNSTVTVNGTTVNSGSQSDPVILSTGSNTITIVVTSQDGTASKTYTVVVIRAPQGTLANADLSNLVLSAGTLNPVFSAGTLAYTAIVTNATSSITLTPTAFPGATVKVNGATVMSGSASGAIPLALGSNTITIVVTAEDGTTTKTYTVVVTRAASTDADLSSLTLSAGTLSPAFSAGILTYIASVSNATSSITLTATVETTANISINGVAVSSGNPSGAFQLNGGSNIFTIKVISQGAVTKTYTVVVTRTASTNADLSNLALSAGILSPDFAAGTLAYTATVTNAINSITLTPTAFPGATVKVNGATVGSGSESVAISLAVGVNTITTVVTAEDGTTNQTYTVIVTRQLFVAAPANADLFSLSITDGTLSPAFSSDKVDYTTLVSNSIGSIKLTPITVAGPGATVMVNGMAVPSGTQSGDLALIVGNNTITTIVTSSNGSVSKTYTLQATRLPAGISTQTIAFTALPDKTYGDASFAAGPELSSGGLTVTYISSNTSVVTLNGNTVTIVGAGTATITASQSGNAAFIPVEVSQSLTVKPKTITVTADAKLKTYGSPDPALTYSVPAGSLVGTDNLSIFSGALTRTAGSIVANYPILRGSLSVTANYTINYVTGNFAINTAPLIITADNKVKEQGTANPPLTVTYAGFIPNENDNVVTTKPTLQTTATLASPNGDYPITFTGSPAVAANYNITYVPGTLSVVTGQPTNITLAAASLLENQAAGSPAATLSTVSPNPNAVFTYTLVSGAGSTDNASFSISGNQLVSSQSLDFENKSQYAVRVRSTTQLGLFLEKTFIITLGDVNEQPTLNVIANQELCSTLVLQAINISGITPGPESAQATTLTVSSSNADLFDQLSISNAVNGVATLSYQLKPGANGIVNITVKVKDNGGTVNGGADEISRVFKLTVNALPANPIFSDKGASISKGEIVTLLASGGNTYSWIDANGIIGSQNTAVLTARPTQTTTYQVNVTNATGCSALQNITIEVREDYQAVKATNLLSPNGDGINDTWMVYNADMYPGMEVKIYDDAYRLIFSQKNYAGTWDGTFEGRPLKEGSYFYVIDPGTGFGKFKGFITLLRDR